jgi:hypothetical protein
MQQISYEQQALECRKLASEMKDPIHQKQMEDMAAVWDILTRQQSQQTKKARSASEA